MPTALVTGATSGIGAAFARRLAADGSDLVLVARDAARLDRTARDLRDRDGIAVQVLAVDLATDDGCGRTEERLGAGVDLLVNNAGIGLVGDFAALDRAAEERQLRLNVRAVLRLAHAALPPMLERGRGGIVNVSSVAAFMPSGESATYGASKAWVTAFSDALHLQYADRGVRVLSLHPGLTRTEMHARSGVDVSGVPDRVWLQADDVAAAALADLARGRARSTPGGLYKAVVAASRLVPPATQLRLARRVRRRVGVRPGAARAQ